MPDDKTTATLDALSVRLSREGLDPGLPAATRVVPQRAQQARDSQLSQMLMQLRTLPIGHEGEEPGDGESHADFVIVGRLGEGGMGVVELARQDSLGREVALKRLKRLPQGPEHGFGLLDEARIHGSLEHPNIAPVHAVGLDATFGPVVVLKRVQGEPWSKVLRRDTPSLPGDPTLLERHLRILAQVANAVAYAHSRGILHRDLKPDNVMLGSFGEVYLMDWGIALERAAARPGPGPIAGTVAYMAPEMVKADASRLDERTDVFLLGAILHEILTGEPRNQAQTLAGAALKGLLAEPARYPPEVPPGLGSLANRACARDPDDRFPTATAFREALEDALDLREARLLVDAARALLDEAEREERTSGLGSSIDAARERQEASRRFAEARFALEQSLRARPTLAEAEEQRRRGLILEVRWLVGHGDVQAASALAAELGDALPRDVEALLDAARTRREKEQARLRRLEAETDLSFGRRARVGLMGAILVATTIVNFLELWLWPGLGLDLPPIGLLAPHLTMLGVISALFVALRGKLLYSGLDRQLLQALGVAILVTFVNRVWGILADTPPPDIYARDALLACALLATLRFPRWPGLLLSILTATAILLLAPLGYGRYIFYGLVEVLFAFAVVFMLRDLEPTGAPRGAPSKPPR